MAWPLQRGRWHNHFWRNGTAHDPDAPCAGCRYRTPDLFAEQPPRTLRGRPQRPPRSGSQGVVPRRAARSRSGATRERSRRHGPARGPGGTGRFRIRGGSARRVCVRAPGRHRCRRNRYAARGRADGGLAAGRIGHDRQGRRRSGRPGIRDRRGPGGAGAGPLRAARASAGDSKGPGDARLRYRREHRNRVAFGKAERPDLRERPGRAARERSPDAAAAARTPLRHRLGAGAEGRSGRCETDSARIAPVRNGPRRHAAGGPGPCRCRRRGRDPVHRRARSGSNRSGQRLPAWKTADGRRAAGHSPSASGSGRAEASQLESTERPAVAAAAPVRSAGQRQDMPALPGRRVAGRPGRRPGPGPGRRAACGCDPHGAENGLRRGRAAGRNGRPGAPPSSRRPRMRA